MFGFCLCRRSGLGTRFTFLCSAVFTLMVSSVCWAQNQNTAKRILLLYPFDNEVQTYSGFDHALRSQLRSGTGRQVEFYTEYLDLVRFPAPTHAASLVRLLKLKYDKQKLDLIVPVSYSVMQFLLKEGKDLFPGTPAVALFNVRRMEELKQNIATGGIGRGITGVASTDQPTRTLDLALRLQPDTQRVVIVIGSSPLEKLWVEQQLQHDFSQYSQRVGVTFLTGLTMSESVARLAKLPPHTVILSTLFVEDAAGQFFLQDEALAVITRAADVPVYAIYASDIGHGVVGGRTTDSENLGRKVASLAQRILNGENAANIPIVVDDSSQDMVDWRQLKRWHISENRLPSGAVELFREPSLWERYRFAIVAVISLCILETLLILSLLFSIKRRQGAEKALLREKTLADAVIESLPGIFVLQDRAGKNLRWNKNAELLARYGLTNIQPLSNVADKDKASVRRARDEAFKRGSSHVEANVLVRNRGTAPYYFTGVRVVLEGKPYVAAIGIDLTESKQAEEALRRSEAELRSFVEHAPYGIGTISVQQDRFLRANPALVKLLGYKSEAEVLALTVSRDLYADGDARGFRAQPTQADFFSAVEFTWKRKDGKPVTVRASGRRLSGPETAGDIIEIIAEDVTVRKLLEDQLRQAQKMEALGQLAGSIAHDFNNLLSVIIGYSELLSTDSEGLMSVRLAIIKRAGQSAAALTSQLLAFSRRQAIQPKILNLNSLVAETQRMLQRLVGENIEQKLTLDPTLGKTKADPGQIVQVIMNLAVNARDAMPTGGKLAIETTNVTFEEGTYIGGVEVPPGDYVLLSVRDTGMGMDAETQAHIFEPFFTTKAEGKGTGLGLATVYGIVKQNGGYVFADSELGKGTIFRVYLPQVNQPLEIPSLNSTETAKVSEGSETLLVVEDEPAFRDLLHAGLQSRGYQVLVASNGVEALQVAERHSGPIRILITDVIMPQMSGPELAKSLKKVRRNTQVLYMSGYTDDRVKGMSSSDGELTLIQKPFYIGELVRKIQEIMGRNEAQSGSTSSL
jgi:two-component system cell cycle sensor histidine kinase/response regulator CckA